VVGGRFNDRLTGNAAGQNLTGAAGADTLAGAGGIDTLWGGTGTDTFVFREMGSSNADKVNDFASGSDKLVLDASVMSALGAAGNFAAGDARFWSSGSGTAHDADTASSTTRPRGRSSTTPTAAARARRSSSPRCKAAPRSPLPTLPSRAAAAGS
jgi:Ca2+-binding RTX toxin-like protein